MKKIQGGSNEENNAMERIYYSHFAPLVNFASNFIPRAAAKDAVQEIFCRIWKDKQILSARFTEADIRAYLYRAALNACRDYAKHRKVEETYVSRFLHAIRLDEIDFHETKLMLEKKDRQLETIFGEIDKLPERCREIFRRHYLRQESCAMIAKDMDISVRTVEAQLYKALKIIRQAMPMLLLSNMIIP